MKYVTNFLINLVTLSNQDDFPDESIKYVSLIEYVKPFYINALKKNIYNVVTFPNLDGFLEEIIKFVSLNNLLQFS